MSLEINYLPQDGKWLDQPRGEPEQDLDGMRFSATEAQGDGEAS